MLNLRILLPPSVHLIQKSIAVAAAVAAIVITVSIGSAAFAQSSVGAGNAAPVLDDASKTAMSQTQNLLKNQAEREKSMTTPDAKKTDQQVKDLMGSDTQGAYDLAAEIFPTLVNESGGDPIKMQATLSQMMKSPESLAAKLTPEQMAKLKELAKRAETRQPANNAH